MSSGICSVGFRDWFGEEGVEVRSLIEVILLGGGERGREI